jgi:hypothetical protein
MPRAGKNGKGWALPDFERRVSLSFEIRDLGRHLPASKAETNVSYGGQRMIASLHESQPLLAARGSGSQGKVSPT